MADVPNVQQMIKDLEPFQELDQFSKAEQIIFKNLKALVETDVPLSEINLINLQELWEDHCVKEKGDGNV